MSNGDSDICKSVQQALEASSVFDGAEEIQNATKLRAKSGSNRAVALVYNSGKIVVQGPDSELKNWLLSLKQSIESGSAAPGILLPAEIERFPQTLRERVPDCDDVVLWFFQESLLCYKADSIAGSAFMLGAASEKAILILIDAYIDNIADEDKSRRLRDRTNNRTISVRFDEFKRSYKSAQPRPTELPLAQDLDQLLEGAFNFYRYTRNTVGHPAIIPDLDKGIILANLGQFITYVERIYALIDFFNSHQMRV